jgi:high-affinity nickel-transport protein
LIAATAGSATLVLFLGLRHGLDADHLAAIDGLTRWNARERRSFAPYCGALFSIGHVSIILAMAVGFAIVARQWQPPAWLELAGTFISAATLIVLSAINLRIAFNPTDGRSAGLVGLRTATFAALLRTPNAWHVALLGGLFALSVDAVALAALFAASASPSGDAAGAGGLALLFGFGMVAVGTASGRWVLHLIGRSDEAGRSAQCLMTITIALVGFVVGAGVLLTLAVEPLARWATDHDLAISGFVVAAVLASYFGALTITKRSRSNECRAGVFAGTLQGPSRSVCT